MSSYARANLRITNEKNKRKIPVRASRGLKWGNKMYKLKRSISHCIRHKLTNWLKCPVKAWSLRRRIIVCVDYQLLFSSLLFDGLVNDNAFILRIFYMDIFKCASQHFVGDFARLLYGAVHNAFYVTSRIHRCPQNRMSDARPQHREYHALLFKNSVWVL